MLFITDALDSFVKELGGEKMFRHVAINAICAGIICGLQKNTFFSIEYVVILASLYVITINSASIGLKK